MTGIRQGDSDLPIFNMALKSKRELRRAKLGTNIKEKISLSAIAKSLSLYQNYKKKQKN